jgi:hypothetical protein
LIAGAAWLLLLVTMATACSNAGDGTSTSDEGARLSAALQQYREDEVKHIVKIQLTNTGSSDVVVSQLRLAWPGLRSSATAPDYPLGAGQEAALPVPYSEASCPRGSTGPPAEHPVAIATIRSGTGEREVRLTPTDTEGVLARIWTADCRRQALDAAVDVRFGDTWAPTVVAGVPGLEGTIEVRRKDAPADVSVTGISGSVLLDIVPVGEAGDPLLRLGPGQPAGELPVAVTTSHRCDGHAIGESKKPYEFNVQVALGGDAPGPVTITPDAATRQRMLGVIEAGCGINLP